MARVAVIDYGMCNLDSVARAIEECGGKVHVTENERDIKAATHIVLPGVGAFPDAMRNLREHGLVDVLTEQVIEEGTPFLGICLGMQVLASRSWEGGETAGLGWIDAEVRRLESFGEDTRIPHMGWNEVHTSGESVLWKGVPATADFYFAHSYHLVPRNEREVLGRTPYGKGFVAAVQTGNAFGVQFHPEKSQRMGFQVLRNFLSV